MKQNRALVLVASCINMIWIGTSIFAIPGIMAPYWQSSLGVTAGAVSKCPFWILLATGIFMYVVGRLQEVFSCRILVLIGSIILGATNFFIAFISSIYHIFVWAFFVGCASAFLYIPCITAVQRWFLSSKGLVVGLVNLVFGISASFLGPPLNHLLSYLEIKNFSLVVAFMSFFTGSIFSPFVIFPEYGKKEIPEEKVFFSVKSVLKNKNFWLVWMCWAFTGGAGISMITLATLFGVQQGLSKAKAIFILSSFNLANGAGRLFTGLLSDRAGRTKTMFWCFLLGGIGYVIIPFIPNMYVWCICAIAIGLSFGALFAVSAPLIMELFGTKHFGAVFGLVFTAYGFVAGPLGPWTSGYLLNLTNSFLFVFLYLGSMLFVSSILVIKVKKN